ncbi:MAG: UvrB/UvrC motif-containing protein [Oscillospiraceae bacterium]|jgi:protein arginine kinase activator|nr:UvrB/UvrC motif-containing protein [Oscillospiraceae bacterium]
MLCDICKKNQANTVIEKTINGKFSKQCLCADCAAQAGYGAEFAPAFEPFPFEFGNLFNGFFGNALPSVTGVRRCEFCGCTFNDIKKSGNIGCAECYSTFADELLPMLQSIHGNTEHKGRRPLPTSGKSTIADENSAAKTEDSNTKAAQLNRLKKDLAAAIDAQEFEQAAVLRDKINELNND